MSTRRTMGRFVRAAALAITAVAVVAMPAAAQSGVAGKWTLTLNTSEGVMSMDLELEQNGSEVLGTGSFAMAESLEISDGLYEDGVVSFLIHMGIDGQFITAEVEAEVDGDAMEGDVYVPEMGEGASFTGKRQEG